MVGKCILLFWVDAVSLMVIAEQAPPMLLVGNEMEEEPACYVPLCFASLRG